MLMLHGSSYGKQRCRGDDVLLRMPVRGERAASAEAAYCNVKNAAFVLDRVRRSWSPQSKSLSDVT